MLPYVHTRVFNLCCIAVKELTKNFIISVVPIPSPCLHSEQFRVLLQTQLKPKQLIVFLCVTIAERGPGGEHLNKATVTTKEINKNKQKC